MLNRTQPALPGLRTQRGMSLVELMVGVAIGLVIVAAASFVMTSQLVENRRLLSETQVQQDLRAAADVMARDIRRAGAISDNDALAGVWYPGATGTQFNSRAAGLSVSGSGSRIDYEYFAGALAASPTYAYQLSGTTIKTLLSGTMQDLTDPNAMRVTSLSMAVTTDSSGDVPLPCPSICTLPVGTGPTDCWPRVKVRRATLAIQSQSRADASVKRAVAGSMRLRNDMITFADPVAQQACPS